MSVIFFPTRIEAETFERKCYLAALANGQKCDRWAEIIVSIEGYGITVKDRIKPALTGTEIGNIVEWTPPQVAPLAAKVR